MALDHTKPGSSLKQALGEHADEIAADLELNEQKLNDGRRKSGFQPGNKLAAGHKGSTHLKTKIKSCLATLEAMGFDPWQKSVELYNNTDSDKVKLGLLQAIMKFVEPVQQTVKVEHKGAPTKIVFQWQGNLPSAIEAAKPAVIDAQIVEESPVDTSLDEAQQETPPID